VRSLYRQYKSSLRAVTASVVYTLVGAFSEAGALALLIPLAGSVMGDGGAAFRGDLGPFRIDAGANQILVMILGLTLLSGVAKTAAVWLRVRAVTRWESTTRAQLIEVYLSAEYRFQTFVSPSTLQEYAGAHVDQAATVLSRFAGGLNAGFSLVALLVTAIVLNPIGAGVMGLLGLTLALLLRPLAGRTKAANKLVSQLRIPMGRQVSQIVEHARNIKIFGAANAVVDSYVDSVMDFSAARQRSNLLGSVSPVVHQTAGLLFFVGALWASIAIGTGTAPTLGAVLILLLRGLSYMQILSTNQQMINQALPYATRLNRELIQISQAAEERGDEDLEAVQRIELEDVSYRYLDDGGLALTKITFSLEPPGIIGLAGPSGSGKSTLAHLILGLLRPTAGEVLINGLPIQRFSRPSWVKNVALVPQDLQLIDGTVQENIAFFREVGDAEVRRVAQSVGLDEFISTLPKTYQTELGTTVHELSGGQRQRLGIARALVGRPTLLVLDEPTSALDAETEAWLQEALRSYARSALVVIITHRASTLSICDVVIELGNGRLVSFRGQGERAEMFAPKVAEFAPKTHPL
jgi:ABC-type multidrug transport system fused ATPase/permease subunit